MRLFLALLAFSLNFPLPARASDPHFIEYGIVTLTDRTPSVRLPTQFSTRWLSAYNVPEILLIRMDVEDVERELQAQPSPGSEQRVCLPTVRVLADEGYAGINSVTYGGRIRTSGKFITIKAIRSCHQTLRFKVRAVVYWNANQHPVDMPKDLHCTRPTEGWCRN